MAATRPTIFISYASEDLAAVLPLRDALASAGLDVWLDENELGGGDAWDQKIRRQIRECDYFMPVISATTERRKEGYFRREWRLAAERTLDMADDVMFLLPVAIDDTREAGARVPEKFVMVQWLRVPGGAPNAAIETLARRLATGDHHLPPPLEEPPPVDRPPKLRKGAGQPDGPPPMPPFPQLGDNHHLGHRMKFFAEVLWWALTAGWMLFRRAPRWLRILVTIWFVMWGFSVSQCNRREVIRNEVPAPPGKPVVTITPEEKAAAKRAARAAAEKFAEIGQAVTKPGNSEKLANLGSQLARTIAAELKNSESHDKLIVAVPFTRGAASEAEAKFLGDVFTPLYGRLAVGRAGETGMASQALAAVTNESLAALGEGLDAGYVLGGWLASDDGAMILQVRLMKTEDATVAWSGHFPVAGSDPSAIAEQIATSVLAAVPAK
jgi:hypothetical protein